MLVEGPGWPWDVLDLPEATRDPRSIRRAYGKRLKDLAPTDVAAFEALRGAYEFALSTGDAPRPRGRVPLGSGALPPVPQPAALPVSGTALPPAGDLPPPSPDGAAEAASPDVAASLLARVETLLSSQLYHAEDWRRVLGSLALVDRDTALWVERRLLKRLDAPAGQAPPKEWIRLLDAQFGWRQDGVRFSREFGALPLALQRMVEADKEVRQVPRKSVFSAGNILWIFAVWFLLNLVGSLF